jgi:pyruvate ferredoxin oxidoreductase delta subunit
MKDLGWDELEPGAILFSFNKEVDEKIAEVPNKERPHAITNSITAYVGDWRVNKPVLNKDFCIDCQNCWVFCPDMSIISDNKEMVGIEYDHCKGCGICVDVCPTNPKSLLMFTEHTPIEEALASWPEKEKKEK